MLACKLRFVHRPAQAQLCAHDRNRLDVCRQLHVLQACASLGLHGRQAGSSDAHTCVALAWQQHTLHTSHFAAAVVCVVLSQVRIIEAAKEKLQKDMRSNSSKNLAAMVSVQA